MTSNEFGPLTLHYGAGESWTAAEHFRRAAGARTTVWDAAHGEHRRLTSIGPSGNYLWVESGRSSYPLDSHHTLGTTAGYLIDVHLHPLINHLQAGLFDIAFVAQSDHIRALEAHHPNVCWLPLAAPRSFLHLARRDRYDVAFVGSTTGRVGRMRLLEVLSQRFRMNEWWRFHTPEEMGEVYASSRIVLNIPVAADLNMRFFEAMAAGATLLQPPISNGGQAIARRGEHYLESNSFHDASALATEISALLSSNQTARIGEAARELIARAHTYEHRLETIESAMPMQNLTRKRAPVRGFGRAELRRHWAELSRRTGDGGVIRNLLREFPEAVLRHPAYLGGAVISAYRRNRR